MNENMLQPPATRRSGAGRLTCAQCERMLLDAADGTLLPEDQAQFDLHLAHCESCSRAMADAQRGSAWLGMLHATPPEPPVALLNQILAQTSGNPSLAIPLRPRNEPILSYAGGNYAIGTDSQTRMVAFGPASSVPWYRRLIASVSQPRFAMTAAMAFFSIALTLNLTGVQLRNLHASSFSPANLRHTFWATNARVFRYYDNLRVVYELESRVREVQRDTDDAPASQRAAPAQEPAAPPRKGTAAPRPGEPRPGEPRPAEPRSSLPASSDSHPHATAHLPSHPQSGMLPSSSLTASAALNREEGARA